MAAGNQVKKEQDFIHAQASRFESVHISLPVIPNFNSSGDSFSRAYADSSITIVGEVNLQARLALVFRNELCDIDQTVVIVRITSWISFFLEICSDQALSEPPILELLL
jgi:hypothetical protein